LPTVILSFEAFDASDVINGIGELNIDVNGVTVANLPCNFAGVTCAGFTGVINQVDNVWAPFAIDISAHVVGGTNTIRFWNPLTVHSSGIRNVTVTVDGVVVFNDPTSIANCTTACYNIGPGTSGQQLSESFALGLGVSGDFTANISGLAVALNATASGGTAPYSFTWAFGDGTAGSGQTVNHSYAAAGTYAVSVTITDSVGGTLVVTHPVTVQSGGGGGGPFILSITSSPGLVNFNLVGPGGIAPFTTPYSASLPSDSYTIEMPPNMTFSGQTYNFQSWNDGTTNPNKIISLVADTTVSATYVLAGGGLPPTNTWIIVAGGIAAVAIAGTAVYALSKRGRGGGRTRPRIAGPR